MMSGQPTDNCAANVIRGERLFAGDRYLANEYGLYIQRHAGDLRFLERERLALIFWGQVSSCFD